MEQWVERVFGHNKSHDISNKSHFLSKFLIEFLVSDGRDGLVVVLYITMDIYVLTLNIHCVYAWNKDCAKLLNWMGYGFSKVKLWQLKVKHPPSIVIYIHNR